MCSKWHWRSVAGNSGSIYTENLTFYRPDFFKVVIRRAILTPSAGGSASKIDPLQVGLMRCSLLIPSERWGNADSGDDRPDSARAFYQRQNDQGDLPGSEGIPEHGPRGSPWMGETTFEYDREVQPRPTGRWTAELDELLEGNTTKPFREQLTLIRIFEELRGRGYDGGYDAVRRYARRWAKERGQSTAAAYVPLSFAPGEAYQFDWSHEVVLLSGVTVIVKAAHVRLCHSRMLFVRAYPRETQEMVFDAHDRAFALFKGACGRGIYDNMKTAVETIFVGKGRLYNRRFLQMCSHYLVDPVACTPASGWEKGQVENQVGLVRQQNFAPRAAV